MHHTLKRPEQEGPEQEGPEQGPGQAPPYDAPISRGWVVTITPRSIWLAAGIVVLLIAFGIVLLKAMHVLILFFIAIIIAEGIRPVVDWLQSRRVPRSLSVLLTYLGILVVFAGLAYLLVQPVVTQLTRLSSQLPQYIARIQDFLSRYQQVVGTNPQIGQALNQAGGFVQEIASLLLQIPLLIGTILFSIVIVATITFFWLTGVEQFQPFVVGLFPSPLQSEVAGIIGEMGHKIGGYLRGVVFNSFVIGILSAGATFILHVPYPILLGILAGLTELIPYFGPWISGGVAALVALIAVGPLTAVLVVVVYIIIQQFEGNVLVPLVMMRAVELNPLTVVIAVLLGTALVGIIGGILAVPAAVVVQVLVVRAFAPAARHASERQTAVAEGSTDSRPGPAPPQDG